jgi:hypothetical protein
MRPSRGGPRLTGVKTDTPRKAYMFKSPFVLALIAVVALAAGAAMSFFELIILGLIAAVAAVVVGVRRAVTS